jgi:CheY-like chemotaxis protein/nitrogen-specific signal transduction histidine kinase
VDVIAEPEFSANGDVCGFVAVVVDISDRKSLHDALVRARRHAEAAALSKANLLGNMSHEIRTPMNGVLGFADLLLECDLDGDARNFAEIIASSGKEMMRLLNDILDLSKIEAGEISLAEEIVDLRPMLKGCADLMSAEAATKGLLLDMQIFPNVPNDVWADRGRLRQIVLNLLGNAVKFTNQGSITLSARCIEEGDGPRLAIEVADSGIGIAANKLHTIFEPFAQGDNSTSRQFGGTGLGLTICRQLARKMGGDIRCESVLGRGSRFLLDLPLASAGNETPGHDAMALDQAPAVATTERSLRNLLAEDLSINQKLVQKILARDGHDVAIANNGHEAVAMVDAAHGANRMFDLVLMDVQMPGLDGLEATRAIRERGFSADVLPIIALTANAFPEDVALCRAAGMQDHIEKPINRLALLKTVSSLAGKQQSAQPIEMIEAFTLDDPDLRSDFDKRKRDLVHAIRQAFEDDHDLADYSDLLLSECHKMAGVAGLFGEVWIGAMAAELERRLQQQQGSGPDSEIRKLASQLGAELDKAA